MVSMVNLKECIIKSMQKHIPWLVAETVIRTGKKLLYFCRSFSSDQKCNTGMSMYTLAYFKQPLALHGDFLFYS